jgi:hypothetical protein
MGLTTDPNDPRIGQIGKDGQQKAYLILSDEERSKGFFRPLRLTYIHLACGGTTRMALPLAETYARDPGFYSGTYCCKCQAHFPLKNEAGEYAFVWDSDNSPVGS